MEKYTTKNLIALEFNSIDHKKGSFKAFKDNNINSVKECIINDFLSIKNTPNNKKILLHWEKTMLKILKRRLLEKLVKTFN